MAIYILVTKNHLEINGCSEIQDFQIIDQDFPTILKVYNIQLQNIKVHVLIMDKETLEKPYSICLKN